MALLFVYWPCGLREDVGAFFFAILALMCVVHATVSFAFFVVTLFPDIEKIQAFNTVIIPVFLIYGSFF